MKLLVKIIQTAILLVALSATVCFAQNASKDTTKANPTATTKTNSSGTKAADSGKNATKGMTAADSAVMKKYKAPRVFTGNIPLTRSDKNGNVISGAKHPTADKGQGFDVVGAKNGNLILQMWVWTLKKELPDSLSGQYKKGTLISFVARSKMSDKAKLDLYKRVDIISKRKALNYKEYGDESVAPRTKDTTESGNNTLYFAMNKDSVDQLSVVEASSQKWDIQFGILTVPSKIRFRKFAFTNNAGIGTAVFFERKFKHSQNWSWGLVPSFSLTSVTLDAASTNVHGDGNNITPASAMPVSAISTSTTRPAFTPSASYVIAYKNINFILGAGMDFISKPSDVATNANPEAGWIYNGKPWLGIGFGVSLFGNNSTGSTASATGDQAPVKQ